MNAFLRTLPPILVLGAGLAGAAAMVFTKPKAERAPSPPLAPLVETITATRTQEFARVSALGTVIAAREVILQPEVAGRVVEVSSELVPGGRVKKGQMLLRLDAREYGLLVEREEAAVERAKFELAVEEGRKKVAEREWGLLEKDLAQGETNPALALREPHLAAAKSALVAAKSALERARLGIERTKLVAPFDAFVQEESVDVGQLVAPGTRLATLVGSDELWVQVSVPLSSLGFLEVPGVAGKRLGAKALVTQEVGGVRTEREGRVLRLLGDLDPKGRMARLLVKIADPLSGPLPMLLGALVRVELEGRTMEEVVALPRLALRDQDQVWTVGADTTLQLRRVEVLHKDENRVFIRQGLETGERVITSRLSAPSEGMPLRVVKAAAGGSAP